MRNLFTPFTLFVFQGLCTSCTADDLRRTWTLYHSMDPKLGDRGFRKRGVVTLEATADGADNNKQAKLSIENDENSLTAADWEKVMSSGWYQVKLVEEGDDAKNTVPVKTTVPACHLRRANFR